MPKALAHLHAIVLAGGSGTRFWPLSRELTPKQMLTVFGGTSLLQQAVARVRDHTSGTVTVLTSERLLGEIRDHLAAETATVVAEPSARNTAAAVALAAAYAASIDEDAVVAVLPSDHLLESGAEWDRALETAVTAAESGHIVVLGLAPDAPETGYGYIRPGDALEKIPGAFSVDRFLEKPSREVAEELVAHGCLWNSGMVIARARTIIDELRAAGAAASTPDSAYGRAIADTVEALATLKPGEWLEAGARERYDALPAVQFDRAVLEVSGRVAVVPTRLVWSDVGSLLSLEQLAEPDESGNVLVGNVVDVESSGVISYSSGRLVATLGLKDTLVVDTADATLVASKDRAQDVRLVVEALAHAGAQEIVTSRTSLRPWGSWTLLLKGDGFQVKTIDVLAGKRLSLQSHAKRSEHWVVVSGRALVERDGETLELSPNESVYIPLGATHRLANAGDDTLRVIEVAVGGYLGEDDIVRYADDWSRASR